MRQFPVQEGRMIAVIYSFIFAWLATGLIFAIPFAFFGAQRILPDAASMSLGARILIIPGAAILWPWLLWRWVASFDRKVRE
jgi:hypothetical protein